MQEFNVLEPARREDGSFVVTLANEEGYTISQGEGATYEEALEDAKSKL
jgi:predicted RNase H-like HicB family nuclease